MTQRPCRRAAVNRVRRLCFQHREVMSPVQQTPEAPSGLPSRRCSLNMYILLNLHGKGGDHSGKPEVLLQRRKSSIQAGFVLSTPVPSKILCVCLAQHA